MNTESAASSVISGKFTISVNPPQEVVLANPENTDYIILNTSCQNNDIIANEELRKYHSVIMKVGAKNELLSVAPQIPMPFVEFETLNPIMTEDIEAVRMSEGTLIQLFYDPSIGDWEIATRSRVGGNHWHYRTEYNGFTMYPQKTFRQMFYDAIENCALVGTSDEYDDEILKVKSYATTIPDYNSPLSANPFIRRLNKQYCYFFVLKHPANPIIHFIWLPSITLIAVNQITATETPDEYCVHIVRPSKLREFIPSDYHHIIQVQESVREQLRGGTLSEQAYSHAFFGEPGLMFIDTKTGQRAVLENPRYLRDMELRGNHSNLQYQFFELRRENRLGEFMLRFPQFGELFRHFATEYQSFVMNVYDAYYRYFVCREKIERNYHRIVVRIQQTYLPILRGGRPSRITPEIVFQYFDAMTTSQIMYAVNNVNNQ
jgi:hypothetical protein